jgi:hypothetical protein
MPYRLLCLADLHIGSTVAPWPRNVSLADGGLYEPSRAQAWLNRCLDSCLETCLEYDHFDAVVVCGDAIDGTEGKNAGLVTNRDDVQIEAAVEVLSPFRELADHFYMVAGTGWHVGRGAQNETLIADGLDATASPEGRRVWPFLFLDMGGVVLHAAHHIGATSNPLYEPTALWRDFCTLRLELQRAYGQMAPDVQVTLRAHRHRQMHIQKGIWHAVAVSGWQLKTDFAHKVAPSSFPEVGPTVIEVSEGEVTVRQISYQLPRLHVEGSWNG